MQVKMTLVGFVGTVKPGMNGLKRGWNWKLTRYGRLIQGGEGWEPTEEKAQLELDKVFGREARESGGRVKQAGAFKTKLSQFLERRPGLFLHVAERWNLNMEDKSVVTDEAKDGELKWCKQLGLEIPGAKPGSGRRPVTAEEGARRVMDWAGRTGMVQYADDGLVRSVGGFVRWVEMKTGVNVGGGTKLQQTEEMIARFKEKQG